LVSSRTTRLPGWLRWLDADNPSNQVQAGTAPPLTMEWGRLLPFLFLHAGALAVFWVGASPAAIVVAVALYVLRMFAVTGFYHRYFSHRTYATSRVMQFLMGLWGLTAMQRGPLWWAAHHRHHHRVSDAPTDPHSPLQHGFWWAHMGWITSTHNMPTRYETVPDLAKYPELVWLNRFDWIGGLLLALGLLALGVVLQQVFPTWHTHPAQLLVWGFFISTVALFHGTACINSLAHLWGKRRFETSDTSRNNFCLALITLGEGWHNNHHFYQGATRQGIYPWEIDITYYVLKGFKALGLVWNLHPVPAFVYQKAQEKKQRH
jgi:stearoyl-CoA desaturase (delta-9 desaturase)